MEENRVQAKNWAVGCHVAALAGFVGIPFGHILGPLVVWLIKKNEFPFLDAQGKEAINFQISMTIYGVVAVILSLAGLFAVMMMPAAMMMIMAVGLLDLVFIIVAAVKVSNGEDYRYPLAIRIIK